MDAPADIPRLDYSALMRELDSRTAIPPGNTLRRHERKVALRNALKEVVGLISFAEALRSAERNSADEVDHLEVSNPLSSNETDSWNRFLNEAAARLGTICRRIYKSDMTDCIDPYAIPSYGGQHIETMMYLASSLYNIPAFLDLLGPAPAGTSLTAVQSRMRDTNVIPPGWQETLRPHHLTIPLSRFEADYDAATLSEEVERSFATTNFPTRNQDSVFIMTTRKQEVVNILQARAELHQTKHIIPYFSTCQPDQLVLGKRRLAVCDDTETIIQYPIDPSPHQPIDGSNERERGLKGGRISHGFASYLEGLAIDSFDTIWASADCRIKAFEGQSKPEESDEPETNECTLGWTLNSTGYTHAFAVTDEVVFRGNRGGEVAFWKREKMEKHLP
ncbi:hypothetical protein FRC00_012195, partial [Tulasnella sp. 408]